MLHFVKRILQGVPKNAAKILCVKSRYLKTTQGTLNDFLVFSNILWCHISFYTLLMFPSHVIMETVHNPHFWNVESRNSILDKYSCCHYSDISWGITTNEPIPESILIWLFRTGLISSIPRLVAEILSEMWLPFSICVTNSEHIIHNWPIFTSASTTIYQQLHEIWKK